MCHFVYRIFINLIPCFFPGKPFFKKFQHNENDTRMFWKQKQFSGCDFVSNRDLFLGGQMVTVSTGDGRWRLVPKAPFSSLIQVHNGAKMFLLFFFLRYSLLSFVGPKLYNLEALPFTCGQYVAQLTNSITLLLFLFLFFEKVCLSQRSQARTEHYYSSTQWGQIIKWDLTFQLWTDGQPALEI